MSDDDWDVGFAKSVAMFLNGDVIPDVDPRGERVVDDSFLVLVNAHYEDLTFKMPDQRWGETWVVDVDTAEVDEVDEREVKADSDMAVTARSLVVLRRQ